MTLFDDPFQQLAFSLHDQRGTYAVLLGSGISHAAGITTGWEITEDLIRRVWKPREQNPTAVGAPIARRASVPAFLHLVLDVEQHIRQLSALGQTV
jgi:hypothetical protein